MHVRLSYDLPSQPLHLVISSNEPRGWAVLCFLFCLPTQRKTGFLPRSVIKLSWYHTAQTNLFGACVQVLHLESPAFTTLTSTTATIKLELIQTRGRMRTLPTGTCWSSRALATPLTNGFLKLTSWWKEGNGILFARRQNSGCEAPVFIRLQSILNVSARSGSCAQVIEGAKVQGCRWTTRNQRVTRRPWSCLPCSLFFAKPNAPKELLKHVETAIHKCNILQLWYSC